MVENRLSNGIINRARGLGVWGDHLFSLSFLRAIAFWRPNISFGILACVRHFLALVPSPFSPPELLGRYITSGGQVHIGEQPESP